jgi:O-antigen/teichoic acid export membrane protein
VSAGLPVLLLGVTGAIALNYERTLLGFVVDLALVAQYAVAARLVMAVREAPLILFSALIPTSAALDVAGDDRALERIYARAFRLAAVFVLGLTAVVWACAPPALHAWLGVGFEEAGRVARPLAVGFLVPLLATPAIQILTGRSRLGPLSRLYATWGVGFVLANTLWLRQVGFAGAGWGTAAIDVLGTAAALAWLRARGGLGDGGSVAVLARAAGIAVVAAALGEVVLGLLGPADSRGGAFAATALVALAIAATQVALAWVSGLVDASDRQLVAEAIGLRRRGA